MTEWLLNNTIPVTIAVYAALLGVLIVIGRAEGERYRERSGASAQPSLCRTLGRGLRKLGGALGRLRP